MAGSALNQDQQELVNLLHDDLADLVEQDAVALESDDQEVRRTCLEELHQHLDNVGNAAGLVGLFGLRDCCHHLAINFGLMTNTAEPLEDQLSLLQSWGIFLLGYLQSIGDEQTSLYAAEDLLAFLRDPAWPKCLSESDAQVIREQFRVSNLAADETDAVDLPDEVTAAMIDLRIGDDVRPELVQGMMTELPEQVRLFEKSVSAYLSSGDIGDLAPAQRLAHTIKGSANIVGVAGAANLMHYMEDLLEIAARSPDIIQSGFQELLQDAADCLAAIAEFLAGIGPAPEDAADVLTQVIDWVRQFRLGMLARDVDHVLDHSEEMSPIDLIVLQEDQQEAETAVELESGDRESLPDLEHELQHESPYDVQDEPAVLQSESLNSEVEAAFSATENALPAMDKSPALTVDEDTQAQQSLTISAALAQELLRLAGETQITNTQSAAQIDALADSVKSAEQYHRDIKSMSAELEHLVQIQGALTAASEHHSEDQMDPLELERYNELHSFSHKMLELATDSHEAIERMAQQIKQLKSLAFGQQQLNKDSQQLVLELRMVPVKTMTSRFARCVRQASRLTGKSAELTIEGENILMDSRVLHQVADPIMHLLRNAVDHGLESAAERQALGKSAEGNVALSFKQVGETIIIQCRDDGRGLDYQRIAEVAHRRGLIDEHVINDRNILNQLILMPGFSTRDTVSQTSGRGIGLDAVVAQVRDLKGNTSLESEPGEGSCFTMMVPTSILSGHAILVRTRGSSGEQILSIVTRSIEQIIYLAANDVQRENDQWFFMLDDEKLPVTELNDLTQIHLRQFDYPNGALLLTRRPDGSRYGVLVEAVLASQDLVIKPLGRYAYKPQGVVGATILGNGAVSPVVDLQELPGLALESDDLKLLRGQRAKLAEQQGLDGSHERPMALVVDDSLSARRSLAQFVTDMGMDVRTARDGFEAISVLEQRRPVLMLVDLEMPRMNGLELTAHIRSRQETCDIPIIMITSRTTDKHRRMAASAGVTAYLNKPWSDDELLSRIQEQIA